jgi:hypothetical protein
VLTWGVVAIVVAIAVVFGRPVHVQWETAREPRQAVAAKLDELGAPPTDVVLSIDAGGFKYYTDRPGVVTPDDPLEVIEQVARAYDARWLVVERADGVRALAPVLAGSVDPAWIGAPALTVPHPDGGLPRLALYPVCTVPEDARC